MDNKQQPTNDKQPNVQVNFGPKDILQKEFKTKMRGYDPTEVDGFLDKVIKDYETYGKEIDRLNDENARLFTKVDELTKQLNASKNVQDATPQTNSAATNYDILKRLSNLERHVFGSKLTDQTDTNDFKSAGERNAYQEQDHSNSDLSRF
ncbi:cell division protein GpsB [Lactobacillus selangorensis]|uniref:Cell cycle protein GpsB n=1 Tax=Lactobacillus selangorensis TaxID=81857 RepID=A0A0R2G9F7_9LACO|nr:cell division regulator GpsB [Lactobacillus selangorensis]KRN29490.1 cell division protein GpsB [Lactobacillus selangorensis]KRN33980.1 cell division protein GpsB [Lactobacillus selangorensis]